MKTNKKAKKKTPEPVETRFSIWNSCPCVYTKPCSENCPCVHPTSSDVCHRCAGYGSIEQKKKMAEWLADVIDRAYHARVIQMRFPTCLDVMLPVLPLDDGYYYVPQKSLQNYLKHKTKEYRKTFHKLFGIQTMYIEGPYAHDVEAVLLRMSKGVLTGSQLLWD